MDQLKTDLILCWSHTVYKHDSYCCAPERSGAVIVSTHCYTLWLTTLAEVHLNNPGTVNKNMPLSYCIYRIVDVLE